MKEQTKEWKPVVGYEGLYEVSSDGDVRNAKTGRVLKPCIDNLGYSRVYLSKQSMVKYFRVHRLVAGIFLTKELDKGDVNHINGVKSDNRVCNLEWATRSENIQHAWDNGFKESTRLALSRASSKTVVDLWSGIFYDSLKEACAVTNYNYERAKSQTWNKYKTQRFQYI